MRGLTHAHVKPVPVETFFDYVSGKGQVSEWPLLILLLGELIPAKLVFDELVKHVANDTGRNRPNAVFASKVAIAIAPTLAVGAARAVGNTLIGISSS